MRVDLGLECLELALSLFFLLMDVLLHEFLDPVCHHIKRFRETSDLIIRVHDNIRNAEIALLDFFHGIAEFLDRKRDTSCHKSGKKQCHDDKDHRCKHINALCLPAFAQKFTDIGAVYDGPAGFVRA